MAEQIEREMAVLLQGGLKSAFDLLGKLGRIPPFAITNDLEGPGRFLFGAPDEPPEVTARTLRAGLRRDAEAGTLRACVVALEVDVTHRETGQRLDAVQLFIEHVEHAPLACLAPYRYDEEGLERADLVHAPPEVHVFTKAAPGDGT